MKTRALGAPRVALAEDDLGLREAVAQTLRDNGIDVVEAGDGGSLIGILRRGHVALVITDLLMPGLRGDDVLRLYRNLGDDTPFVVITGARTAVVDAVRLSSNVVVLRKPFTVDALLETVSDVLGDEIIDSFATDPTGEFAPAAQPAPSVEQARDDDDPSQP